MAVQGHQRCQGLLSKREKAPNLDRMICNKKIPLVFAKEKVLASRELRFGMVTLEIENRCDFSVQTSVPKFSKIMVKLAMKPAMD